MKTNKVFVSSVSVSASTKLTTASIAAVLTTGLMAMAGPVNDHFADRIPIPGETVTVHGNNTGATRELDEPGIYQPQYSEDLFVWKDLGEEVVGAGQMVSRFMLADQMKTFFRAKKIGVGEPNSTRPDGQ